MFLNPEEVWKLTGYRWPSKQIARLRELQLIEGVRNDYIIGPDGHPKVFRRMLKPSSSPSQTTPDFDALEKVVNLK